MKTSTLFSAVSFALVFCSSSILAQTTPDNVTATIVANADADNIDLTVLGDTLDAALTSIVDVYENASIPDNSTTTTASRRSFGRFGRFAKRDDAPIVDVHTHAVPSWYKALVPTTGGNPTPSWDINTYLSFMASEGITHSVFSFSAPSANVFQGAPLPTIALARLMNEQAAAYCRANPTKLSFYAVVPLPYTAAAIVEANYALDVLGASGIFLTSNFEGIYLGNTQFTPFFDAMNSRSDKQIFYIHPGTPYIKVNGKLVEANPTPYPTGNIEFYFETARTLEDLTLTRTIHNFTNIDYIIPHVGGAFPATIDRILKSAPAIYDASFQIFSTRFWWDSAGPTYYHQVAGLLGYGIPASQLLFGTDYPYAPSFTQAASLAAVKSSTLITDDQKTALFTTNPQALFGSKISS
ncbi:2-amino-3-carboxymuconate-6-semialdehyde decarboxylase [Termitomyces sp. T112]|nr:2-amino-3-carboxymuconate-6-semialdehyde decarboxylase [Termitomyces sp. T112]